MSSSPEIMSHRNLESLRRGSPTRTTQAVKKKITVVIPTQAWVKRMDFLHSFLQILVFIIIEELWQLQMAKVETSQFKTHK